MSGEEDEESNDDCTLAELQRKKAMSTSQEGVSSPCGQLFPSPPKKPRVAARKRKSAAIAGSRDDDQAR